MKGFSGADICLRVGGRLIPKTAFLPVLKMNEDGCFPVGNSLKGVEILTKVPIHT